MIPQLKCQCIYSFWHGVIPTSYFIFNDFYTCLTNFLCRLYIKNRGRSGDGVSHAMGGGGGGGGGGDVFQVKIIHICYYYTSTKLMWVPL